MDEVHLRPMEHSMRQSMVMVMVMVMPTTVGVEDTSLIVRYWWMHLITAVGATATAVTAGVTATAITEEITATATATAKSSRLQEIKSLKSSFKKFIPSLLTF